MKKVTIIDYGMSNILSISRAFEYHHAGIELTFDPDIIRKADFLVLPGVGAFKSGMDGLQAKNLVEPIHQYISKGNFFLGVCLGMQLMLETGEEDGMHKGLGLVNGKVKALPEKNINGTPNKIPHIAWSRVEKDADSPFDNLMHSPYMYFVHSYFTELENSNESIGKTCFGDLMFTSMIRKNNIIGTQFHPEKSGKQGLQLLKNFLEL
jgi:imidazole glycerol-phosphate synthase subunit HisH